MYPGKIAVAQIVELIKLKGIRDIIISPGSRNAPFTIAFTQNSFFNCFSIVDERAAAFFAMGRALKTGKPAVVLCTSGSALLNFYPAVAEAFYQQIPLLVLSADRPKAWTDQGDGQTIRQDKVLDAHCLDSFSIDGDSSDKEELWYIQRKLNFGLNKMFDVTKGPVHVNIHLKEPLYAQQEEQHPAPSIIHRKSGTRILSEKDKAEFQKRWNTFDKKIVLIGQSQVDDSLSELLIQLSEDDSVIVLSESLSNHYHSRFFSCIDKLILLGEADKEALRPDLLLTFGGAIVSKKIKQLLRAWEIKEHWSVGEKTVEQDTYQQLSEEILVQPDLFIENLLEDQKEKDSDYYPYFRNLADKKEKIQQAFSEQSPYSDYWVFHKLFEKLRKNTTVHLSNSSIVRYAQLFNHKSDYIFQANRGTSGIDGSSSTALGYASADKENNVLITGDISFFYDSNGLWNNVVPDGFKIILVNNSGGGIFRIIPGPDQSGALEKFFETQHDLTAKHLAAMYKFQYQSVENKEELNNTLEAFLSDDSKAILEVFTPREQNDSVLKDFFKAIEAYK